MNTKWYTDPDYEVCDIENELESGARTVYYKEGVYAITHFYYYNASTMFLVDGVAYEDESLTKKYEE